jgi:hypothetical protein
MIRAVKNAGITLVRAAPVSWVPAIVPEARLRHDAGMTLVVVRITLT